MKSPVDQFIQVRLKSAALASNPTAEARVLVRRLYFDVVGLPPTPAQVHAFVRDYARDPNRAVAALVDELLASPHYGERWGRHWLDVVRYADSDGQEGDADRPNAHHFRDFVIRSLNDDLGFDHFIRWQLAGDEIEPDNPHAIAATGFIAAGTHAQLPDNLMEEERVRTRFNELDDMLATTSSAMLGLTLACARCHDHKYDPIPRRDYYRLLAAFNGGDRAEVPLAPLAEAQRHRAAMSAWKTETDKANARWKEWFKPIHASHETAVRNAKIDTLPIDFDAKTLLRQTPEAARAKELGKQFSKELKIDDNDYLQFLSSAQRVTWNELKSQLDSLKNSRPHALPTAYGFADFGLSPRETYLLDRGDFRKKSERVELGFLTVLLSGKSAADYWTSARAAARRSDSTQQRRAVAEWITDLEHGAGALLARVFVNRIWQHHFGQGLVRTANDFGSRCDPPTHPELLEWLAHQFTSGGWKIKPLHRQILSSNAYLQSTAFDEAKAKIDPDNRLLWRRRPRRIEAEILRDSMLAASGKLDTRMFGPAFKAPVPAEAIQARNMKDPYPKDLRDTPSTWRRSIYMFHKRVVQNPLLQAFDGPDAQASCGRRETTTVAPQALALLNDAFVRARALDFAQRIELKAGSQVEAQASLAWRISLGREPRIDELTAATSFLGAQASQRTARNPTGSAVENQHLALTDLCQAIFAMNEFVYVD